MELRFLSKNQDKFREIDQILRPAGFDLINVQHTIEERQTRDIYKLVRDKTILAFQYVGRPVIVEHTGLFLTVLNDLPGGLTQIFWDALQAEGLSRAFGSDEPGTCVARTVIGYCDGRSVRHYEGETSGRISREIRGDQNFQWDCVFVPDGHDETFAEMGDRKHEISMRRRALDDFVAKIRGGSHE